MNTLALVLGIAGICTCWGPGWGWIGVALGLGGCALSVRTFADPESGGGAIGYAIWGTLLGGFAAVWGAAVQIEHSGGALDALLLPIGLEAALAALAASFAVLWAALFAARRRARGPLLALAVLALASVLAIGISSLVTLDRIRDQAKSAPR